ncbi:peptidylprolyl isomerase, partial [Streptococcus agalactiae]|nr:peptidylprolyl isomerase [Streptococcus agalactiae]
MLNKMKARFLIGLGGFAVISFIIMIGYTIGSQSVTKQTEHQIQSEAKRLAVKEKQKEKENILSDQLVKEFLTQYY